MLIIIKLLSKISIPFFLNPFFFLDKHLQDNQIGSEGEKWLAKFLKERKRNWFKWFENVKSGNFSTLKEMMIQKKANVNWVEKVHFFLFWIFSFRIGFFFIYPLFFLKFHTNTKNKKYKREKHVYIMLQR